MRIGPILRGAACALAMALGAASIHASERPSHAVGVFKQETADHAHANALDGALHDARGIAIGPDGAVHVLTGAGLFTLRDGEWSQQDREVAGGERLVRLGGAVLLLPANSGPDLDLEAAVVDGALGGGGEAPIAELFEALPSHLAATPAETLVNIASGPGGETAAAFPTGVLERGAGGEWRRMLPQDEGGRLWGWNHVGAAVYDAAGTLWIAGRAGLAARNGGEWTFYTGAEGLPYNAFTSAAAGPEGVWFGTERGAIYYDGEDFGYRQGRRWLPDDEVRGVAVDADGNAWFATAGGVGVIRFEPMTLAEKADFYHDELERYIKRTPYGYTSEVRLRRPGDKSEIIYTDSDNDGLWTAMYGAAECYAYAVTGDPEAKARADRAFGALRFLQEVPQMGPHKPPAGYVARTIIPSDWPDPMEGRIERDKRHLAERDSLWKVYETRWVLTDDSKWYWKGDTSSDELDGHYFFYPLYYDLVAETEEEKESVREVVRKLTDHLIDHGYILYDNDGTPTRWSIYAPELLNHDPNWQVERGLKSLSMLSYLAVAEHMTGDPKYGEHARYLRDEHAFDTNAMVSKIQFGLGSGNQSDDEMAIMCFYNLLKYSKDEELKHQIRYAFFTYWQLIQPERNPFFHFAYAAHGLGGTYANPWGTWPISPWGDWLEDSVGTLKGFPLDRVNWRHENSHRIDIVRLPPQTSSEPYLPHDTGRGHRTNGKVLPIQERHFNHWNTDPWRLDTGGDGRTLASGAVYLLPYYMGRYYGFIVEDGG